MVERFHVGQRVRLKDTLETKPPGLFPRGAMGTVTNVGGGGEIDNRQASMCKTRLSVCPHPLVVGPAVPQCRDHRPQPRLLLGGRQPRLGD